MSSQGEDDADGMYLPKRRIQLIASRVLPGDANIDDDAIEAIQECASEFISFLASEASAPFPASRVPRPIDSASTLEALDTLGLRPYSRALEAYASKYQAHVERQAQAPKASRGRPAERHAAT